MRAALAYLAATRHPWPCLLFVMPLLLVHEGGMVWLRAQGETMPAITGVENWFRTGMDWAGLNLAMGPPLAVVAICILWAWIRWQKPSPELLSTWLGIAVESVVFALGLWGLWEVQKQLMLMWESHQPLVQQVSLLSVGAAPPARPTTLAQVIGLIGTGVYEETLFRLLCLSLLAWLLRWVLLLKALAVGAAIIISAVLFAVAHHMHLPFDQWQQTVFIFHTVSGLYFGLLFVGRGFGVTVGAHACFNVLVTIAATAGG